MPLVEIIAFLGLVVVISLSGVLLPGPMTAATIVKSYSDKWAGAKVAVGHAVVEMPLLAIIAMGLSFFIVENSLPVLIIGLLGGGYLLLFGLKILRDPGFIQEDSEDVSIARNPYIIGIATTALNPGFHIWWVTLGVLLVTQALEYGILILLIFGIVHWLCDFVWGIAIGFGISKVREFYASRAKDIIRYVSAAMILFFGAYFAVSSAYHLFTG